MKRYLYSVVATTYNDANEINSYLENIMEQSVIPYEIIIADGGSTDNTVKLIKSFCEKNSKCKIKILSGKRLNISQGYNEAIKNTTCDLIGITGVGNKYASNFFELLLNKSDITGADVVCGFLCGQNNTDFAECYNKVYLNGNNGIDSSSAVNHGAIVKKMLYYQLGFFYENFIYAGEDAEFYSLAKKNGYEIVCESSAKVYWDTPRNYKQLKKQMKNYAIGDMQISDNLRIVFYKKRLLFYLLIGIVLVGGLMINNYVRILSIIGITGVVAKLMYYIKLNDLKIVKLKAFKLFYPLVYYIQYIKYSQKKYKVNRGEL